MIRSALRVSLLVVTCCLLLMSVKARTLHGKVSDEKGNPLGFCTISVLNTEIRHISNSNGHFTISLQPGTYKLVFQHVGYQTDTIEVVMEKAEKHIAVTMKPNELMLTGVVIKGNAEDPAYAIIRNAIRERQTNAQSANQFQCQAYIKGLIRTNNYPDVILGQVINFEDGDTSKKKIIYLSESISDVYFKYPNQTKVIVRSTRVSGQTNGLGLATPLLISFYENIVNLPKTFNPRGFISPISEGALNFYSYRYLGAFVENGHLINKIEVTPRRQYEPLFSGYIQIVEDSWNIHSLSLSLNKKSLLEFADQIKIEQYHNELANGVWLVSSQTIYPDVNFLGFDASGYFTTIYSKYNIQPNFSKGFFGDMLLMYDSTSNKQSADSWESVRPTPLLNEEIMDFRKKDSLERLRENPDYLDSLDKIQNKITVFGAIVNGQTFISRKNKRSYSYDPLLKSVSFNTVEGIALQLSGTYRKDLEGRNELSFTPVFRYGITNRHFNAFLGTNYRFGKKYVNNLSFSFGKRIYQFNNANPIPQIMNTFSTLWTGNNYMKLYQADFFQARYSKVIGNGLELQWSFNYQDRMPLVNRDTSYSWGSSQVVFKNITPNYPTEITSNPLPRHRAFYSTIRVVFRPGTKYIQLPDRIVSSFRNRPVFSFQYTKGIPGIMGSVVDYDKWRFAATGDANFKLGGEMKYRLELGGFLRTTRVEIPDYQHFIGNLTRKSTPYVESFQVAPFYALSNKEKLFVQANIEYRLNGLLTNKIPLVQKFNLRLVTGINAIIFKDVNYQEVFIGVDNVLKLFRFDYVWGFGKSIQPQNGIKIGIRGFSTLFTDY